MWWNVLPTTALMWASMTFPPFIAYYLNSYFFERPCYRLKDCSADVALYFRDGRINNTPLWPYPQHGLENIDDLTCGIKAKVEVVEKEPEKEEECVCVCPEK